MLVTIVSDAMDLLALRDAASGAGVTPKARAKQSFTIPDGEAEAALSAALADWNEPGARDGLISAYFVARAFVSGSDLDTVVRNNGVRIRELIAAASLFFQDDAKGKTGGVALLRALSSMRVEDKSGSSDTTSLLLGYGRAFYEKGQRDQGDLMLLA